MIGLPLSVIGLGYSAFGGGGMSSILASLLGLGLAGYGAGLFGGTEGKGPLAATGESLGLNFLGDQGGPAVPSQQAPSAPAMGEEQAFGMLQRLNDPSLSDDVKFQARSALNDFGGGGWLGRQMAWLAPEQFDAMAKDRALQKLDSLRAQLAP